jgi:hypothetical protein
MERLVVYMEKFIHIQSNQERYTPFLFQCSYRIDFIITHDLITKALTPRAEPRSAATTSQRSPPPPVHCEGFSLQLPGGGGGVEGRGKRGTARVALGG